MLEEFKTVAEAHHITTTQLVIAWTYSQPGITHVLCGARSEQQVTENARAGQLSLSKANIVELNGIIEKYQIK